MKVKQITEINKSLKRFYVAYNEYSEVTRPRSPDDEWDADDILTTVEFENAFIAIDGDTAGKHTVDVTSYAASDGTSDHYFREMDIEWNENFDNIYLVYARYSDGDTFHREEGKWAVIAAFSDIHKAKTWIKRNEEIVGKNFSGYFERYHGLHIEKLSFKNYTI